MSPIPSQMHLSFLPTGQPKRHPLAAAIAILISHGAFAAAQGDPHAPDKTLSSVTVTANKIEEKLKDVPQSVTLLTAEEIQEKGIRNIADLIRDIPNLSSSFVFSNEINFRGIKASEFTNTNPVVIYIDGIPQSNRFSYDALLENVARVEVLRGPQGSLYGKDAIGGVINIVTKTPTNTLSGQAGIEIANQSGRQTTFALNGPLIEDKLFFTLSGKSAEDDGWVKNSYPGMNSHANRKDEQRYRLGLLYKLSAQTQFRLNSSHDEQNNYGVDGGLVPLGQDYTHYRRSDARDARFGEKVLTRTLADAQSFSAQHKFDTVTLDFVSTRKSIKVEGDYDADWGNSPLYDKLSQFQHSKINTSTQELRLSGGKAGETRWVTGLYLEADKYRNTRYGMQYPGVIMGSPFGTGINIDMDDRSTTKTDTKAVFGQLMLPMSKQLELTLGGRYQEVKKTFSSAFYMQPVGSSSAPASLALDGEHRWTTFLPKAALSYDLTPAWKTYASVAKGYLPGGYNHWTSSTVESENRFKPQTSTNYEVGIRSDFGRLYLSAALFYMDIKDIHAYSFDRTSGMIRVSNAGKAHSLGSELEASYLLNDQWEISGGLGLVQARYDEYTSAAMNGKRMEKTPSYTARLGLQYTAGNGFYARTDLRAQGKRYFNPENTLQDGAYLTADVKAGYRTGPWDFYTYVRNLTDTSYLSVVNQQSNGALVTFGERRRIGIGARYSF